MALIYRVIIARQADAEARYVLRQLFRKRAALRVRRNQAANRISNFRPQIVVVN
jgi:hypothetical protein